MAFAPHRRITFSGVFGTIALPLEAWSFRLNAEPVVVNQEPLFLERVRDTWVSHVAPLVHSIARLTEVKVASVDAFGRYTGDPLVLATDVQGLSGGAVYPLQISLAVSLDTATRGARGRGRFYIPAPGAGISEPTRILSAATAQDIAVQMGAFVTALNALPELGAVVVASSLGTNSPVTAVRVGRVLDTIRSRRRSLDESYGADVGVTPSSP